MLRALDIFLIHFFSTAFMTGVIWVIQLVHYPLFARVGAEGYPAYQREHEQRITWIVAPVMLVELGSAIWLVLYPVRGLPRSALLLNLGLLLAIWLSTFVLQVPQHGRLQHGFNAPAHARLVASNWIRAALWSARSVLLLLLLCKLV